MTPPDPHGLCACGCGLPTTISPQSSTRWGYVKGQPRKYRAGHNPHFSGPENHAWTGGRQVDPGGYVRIRRPDHPRARVNGYVHEHVLLVEEALGRFLPRGAEVHHADENKANNARGNLVLCQDRAYHALLHQRQRALDACGDASAMRCVFCGGYDRQSAMYVGPAKGRTRQRAYHRECANERDRQRRAAR